MFRLFKSTLFIASFLLFAGISASTAFAQSIPGISEPVTFQVSPQYPQQNSSVTVSAQSYSTDLNRADFVWLVDGKVFKKGTGMTSITVPIGTKSLTIEVDVSTANLGNFTNTVTVKPGSVELLWQTDGYVPPFYEGKALEAYGATFKVTAIPDLTGPNGKRLDPRTLVYTWKKNDTIDPNQSGYGKDSFTSEQSSFVRGGDTISVEVSSVSGDTGATRDVTISPIFPEVLFYEDSPLYGILYNKILTGSFVMKNQETSLRAEPFNISSGNPLSSVANFEWTLNGDPVPDFSGQNSITFRGTGVSGASSVAVSVQHKNQVLQGGQASISIIQ
ncbi:MAG TPA: hypothetical protein VFT82_00675 [Candidatus Paceibacterota bacterium]|nr:hypothetical protein [Candidatus Paceibacterota bacterium]